MPSTDSHQDTGSHRLRLYRLSAARQTYYITTCCTNRQALLASDQVKPLLAEALQGMLTRGLHRLDGYAIMPDHLHMIFALAEGRELAEVMRDFKKFVALRANKLLGRRGPFWQDGYYEHLLRSEVEWRARLQYMLNNPLRAGLAKVEGEYPWAKIGPWENGNRGR